MDEDGDEGADAAVVSLTKLGWHLQLVPPTLCASDANRIPLPTHSPCMMYNSVPENDRLFKKYWSNKMCLHLFSAVLMIHDFIYDLCWFCIMDGFSYTEKRC